MEFLVVPTTIRTRFREVQGTESSTRMSFIRFDCIVVELPNPS